MQNKNEKISRHCGRGPAIQGFYKGKTALLNRLDPGSMSGMTTKRAFTLIELLVVVLIIGILAAVAVPQYTFAVEKARAAEALTLVRAIATAHTAYYLANGTYGDYPDLGMDIPGTPKTLTDTVHGVETKYFHCRTRTTTGVQYLSLCNRRINDDNSYSIYIETDGKMICSFEGSVAKNICVKLTGKTPKAGYTSVPF